MMAANKEVLAKYAQWLLLTSLRGGCGKLES